MRVGGQAKNQIIWSRFPASTCWYSLSAWGAMRISRPLARFYGLQLAPLPPSPTVHSHPSPTWQYPRYPALLQSPAQAADHRSTVSKSAR